MVKKSLNMNIRRFNESNEFEDIVDILSEIYYDIDDFDIVVYSANGFAFYLDDESKKGKFFMAKIGDRCWKFRIDKKINDFSEFVNLMKVVDPIIQRIKSLGYDVENIHTNHLFNSVEFLMKCI